MIELKVNGGTCHVLQMEEIAAGNKNALQCLITFDQCWEGLEKTVCFRTDGLEVATLLGSDGICTVPWEVLQMPGQRLQVGLYGTKDGTVTKPTVWTYLGIVQPGAAPGEPSQQPPTDVYCEILSKAAQAEDIAAGVRADADNGVFNGDDYVLTPEDKQQIAAQAAAMASGVGFHICGENEVGGDGKPVIAEPSSNMFYLVPTGSESPNLFMEWAYIGDQWEQFGGATVDMSNYVKKTDWGTNETPGLVRGTVSFGVQIVNGQIRLAKANNAEIVQKTAVKPIVTTNMDYALKVAITTNTETLTAEQQAAAQEWLGIGAAIEAALAARGL